MRVPDPAQSQWLDAAVNFRVAHLDSRHPLRDASVSFSRFRASLTMLMATTEMNGYSVTHDPSDTRLPPHRSPEGMVF